jgi:predicted nucleic acid-binding protein
MNVVDSCGWLEYLGNGPNAGFFAAALQDPRELVVPTISLFEVFKRLLQQRGEGAALQAVAIMQQARVVGLDASLALDAARLSLDLRIPMGDSIMLATAHANEAVLWTQDTHFAAVAGVRYTATAS